MQIQITPRFLRLGVFGLSKPDQFICINNLFSQGHPASSVAPTNQLQNSNRTHDASLS